MKIVHVCLCGDVFNEHYAYQDNILPKYHKKMGHEVSIIAPTYSEYSKSTGKILSVEPMEKKIEGGVHLIRLKPSLPCFLNQHIHMFCHFRKTLEALQPDLLFVHGVSSLNYHSLKSFHEKHPSTKIVYDSHADYNNSSRSKITYLYTRYVIRRFVVKNLIKTSDIFYGVTPARCDYLKDMYGVPTDKIHLLPMGADDDEMHFEKKCDIREEVRKHYYIDKDDFLIVTGGKIDPQKNIHVLAQACSQTQYKNIKILIFGSIREDLQSFFEKLKSNRIQLIGWQPSNYVYRFFYAADLVIFPGLHSVLWEQALASQVPCAFNKINGFEHVDFGGNCILMEGNDVEYYQSLIERIYTDQAFYNQLYINAHKPESKQFLYSFIAKKVLDDVYKDEYIS